MAKLFVENRFGVIPNEVLNNRELSFKAKGLFGFIQSKPDGWQFSVDRIKLQTKESSEAISSGLKELENAGYLTRKKYQDDKGYWQIDYILVISPSKEIPSRENPRKENLPNNSNKDISKKELVKKKIDNSEQSSQISELIKEFEFVDKKNKTYYGNKTQRASAKFLIDEYGLDEVIKVIRVLPQTNNQEYFPRIYSPFDLKEKWGKLITAMQVYQNNKPLMI